MEVAYLVESLLLMIKNFKYRNWNPDMKGMVILCFLILPILSFSQESFPGLDKITSL